jgi:hypothetical protein
MARNEADREDLIREAVALTARAELRCSRFAEPVVVGFRSGGAFSVFVDQDPVFHFDAAMQLRRAFVGGRLFRSEKVTLARLTRERSPTETRLLRQDLTADELTAFRGHMLKVLQQLLTDLECGQFVTLRAVPDQESVVPASLRALQLIQQQADWLADLLVRRV